MSLFLIYMIVLLNKINFNFTTLYDLAWLFIMNIYIYIYIFYNLKKIKK